MSIVGYSAIARTLLAGWLVLSLVAAGELGANSQWHDHLHDGGDHHHADESAHVCAAKMLATGLVELADPRVDASPPVVAVLTGSPSVESCFADRLDVSLPPSCGPPQGRASLV